MRIAPKLHLLLAMLIMATLALSAAPATFAAAESRDATKASFASESLASNSVIYIVRPGDTLARIAARYHTTVAAILKANPSIKNPNRILIGQRLVIPTSSGGTKPGSQQVKVYLIAVGSGGSVGCGDSAVAVIRNIAPTQQVLRAALNELLSIKTQHYGQSGLYNALYQSNLKVGNITLVNGTATVWLTGTLRLGGVCDAPRVEAQLTRTATQFSTVRRAVFYVNGKPLKTVLSQK